jgi:hypothetical protein
MAYTKLFQTILHSTIWQENNETRLLWIAMLAMADKNGEVLASIPGLARAANISVEACEEGLEILKAPDKYSRTTDYEGRRIEDIEGGWILLNHSKYREKMGAEERREYNRKKQSEYRARQKKERVTNTSADVKDVNDASITVNYNEQCVDIQKQKQSTEVKSKEQNQSTEEKEESATTTYSDQTLDVAETEVKPREVVAVEPLMAENSFLAIAENLEIPDGFAKAIYLEWSENGWKDKDGKPIVSPSTLLAAIWQAQQVRSAKGSKDALESSTEQSEGWQIDKDIQRIKAEIGHLEKDRGSRNRAHGFTTSFEEHKVQHTSAWLKVVSACHDEAKQKLPGEFAEFENSLADLIAKVSPEIGESEEFRMGHFLECFPDDAPDFHRWDKEWNKSSWVDPDGLTADARSDLKDLRAAIRRLEQKRRKTLSNA